jgi:uncharacterized repeat protein (TIGR01451 family)
MKKDTFLNMSNNVWLLLLVLGFTFNLSSHAQTLGGLPDKTFNPGDSGLVATRNHYSNQIFFPAPQAGVYASWKYNLFGDNYNVPYKFVSSNYYSKDGEIKTLQNDTTSFEQSGAVISTSDNLYFTISNKKDYYNSPFAGLDSIIVSSLKPNNKSKRFNLANSFYFNKPFRGNYKTGIVKPSSNRLVVWLTRHSTDTILPHNTTFVKLLDDTCKPLGASVEIQNFKAILSSSRLGKVYFLGNQITGDTTLGNHFIVTIDGNTLQFEPIAYTAMIPGMVHRPDVFRILPDGKVLIAGRLQSSPSLSDIQEQVLRLNTDGSIDNTFLPSIVSGDNVKWTIDDQNVIRFTSSNYGISTNIVQLGIVQPNGGILSSPVSIPMEYGLCNGLMYHPDYNAFLFETRDIRPTRKNNVPNYDSTYGSRFRFYVSFSGAVWPLSNKSFIGTYSELTQINVNSSLNKMVGTGYFTQVQRKLMPGIAVFNANGTLDTTFKSITNLPQRLKRKLLGDFTNTALPEALLTNSGKVLLYFPRYSNYGAETFSDSIIRLLPNGSEDPSFTPYLSQADPLKRKFWGYFTLRVYENGIPVPQQNAGVNSTVKLVLLDQDGNEESELGSYTSNGLSPDTLNPKFRNTFFEDEDGGLWISHATSPVFLNNYNYQFFVRFDLNGSSRVINPNFKFLGAPLKIEILAGKRMRMTGAFALSDSTLYGKSANVIETDSLGQIDFSFTPIRYFSPNAFGNRDKFYLHPLLFLPDGKVISSLNSFADNYPKYFLRNKADGKQDNSFMPIEFKVKWSFCGIGLLGGNRLIIGASNQDWRRYVPYVGISRKNGIHAFTLNSSPANTGYAQGRVTQIVSPATGCNPTVPQKSARGMLIRSTPSGRIALSDTGGYYTIPLGLGNHSVVQTIENNQLQRQVCPVPPVAGHTFSLASAGSASLGNDFINQTYDCPRLDLKVLDPRFRLCSRTSFQIQYQNDGIAPQPNARIRVNLPEEIRILSASRPYTKDVDSSYVFDLGTLQPGQFGTITTVDTIACPAQPDSLARACFSARIEPLSLCSNIDPASILWDGAWLDAIARYNPTNNKVRVVVYNKGTSMADSTKMRLTGPGLIYIDGKIKLAAGDSLVTLCEPAIQGSIQLQLDQPKACPLGSNSRLNHSGRGTTRAFLNFGSGLLETYTVQACPVWRFSYDPNEKLVEPSGDIEPGTELDYTIHFENYGNDTAYAVTVEDTLPQGLDVKTIKLGASRDPYTLEMAGTETNPVLYFHFRDIKLTGKKQDSIRSKGQLSFKIRTKADVARGSVISNRAHIYFDRNEAVITEYIHSPIAELGVDFVSNNALVKGENKMVVAPNPARGSTKIWFTQSGSRSESKTIRILTMEGKLVKEMQAYGGQAEVKGLLSGIYLITAVGVKPQRLVVIQ